MKLTLINLPAVKLKILTVQFPKDRLPLGNDFAIGLTCRFINRFCAVWRKRPAYAPFQDRAKSRWLPSIPFERWVMSRAMSAMPLTPPALSINGDIVFDTSTRLPSLRRTVWNCCTPSLRKTLRKCSGLSILRSRGMQTVTLVSNSTSLSASCPSDCGFKISSFRLGRAAMVRSASLVERRGFEPPVQQFALNAGRAP